MTNCCPDLDEFGNTIILTFVGVLIILACCVFVVFVDKFEDAESVVVKVVAEDDVEATDTVTGLDGFCVIILTICCCPCPVTPVLGIFPTKCNVPFDDLASDINCDVCIAPPALPFMKICLVPD
ncbi:hypothetical protein DERP_000183 [Dermatophagoides pteronyssinus]|uniref:Uncharacterized protein n=1 Tax=Dermatophagoides pteronyssinus TaxID=6956 RepID=A0ABQ8IZI1_DERPT|nr:hypothetical protein DERP_000183 [Dermatophagoides pteronyssinus]